MTKAAQYAPANGRPVCNYYPLPSSFVAGREAFEAGAQDNPYALDTDEAKEWQRGWNFGYNEALRTQKAIEHRRRARKAA